MPRRRRARCALLPLALGAVLLCNGDARAAGWTQAPGDFYLKLWDRSLLGSRAYSAEGEVVEVGGYQDHQFNAYFEYGLAPRWTLVAFGSPLGYASARRSRLYVGPIVGGARYGLLQEGALKLAIEAHYGFAPGIGDAALLRRSYTTEDGATREATYHPALQNHRGELQLQAGHGLGFGYVSGAVGTRLNSYDGGIAAFTGFVQFGVDVLTDLAVSLQLSTYQPFAEVRVTNASGVGPTRYVGFGLGLRYALAERLGLLAAFDGAFAVESNAATPSLQLGVDVR